MSSSKFASWFPLASADGKKSLKVRFKKSSKNRNATQAETPIGAQLLTLGVFNVYRKATIIVGWLAYFLGVVG